MNLLKQNYWERNKKISQTQPQSRGHRQLMTEGARRCWLIKHGRARACRQGHQPDQRKTSLLDEKWPRRDVAFHLQPPQDRRQGCVWFSKKKKKKSYLPKNRKLDKMQPLPSPQHLPRPPAPPPPIPEECQAAGCHRGPSDQCEPARGALPGSHE